MTNAPVAFSALTRAGISPDSHRIPGRDSSAAAEFRLLPRREGSLGDPYYFGPGYTALVAGIEPSPTVSLTPTGQPVRDRTP